MSKKIILTGGSGFLGSHLLYRFVERGYKVVLLKRASSNLCRIKDLIDMVEVYDTDNMTSFDVIFKDNDIEAIVHAACNYGKNNESFSSLAKDNLLFPLSLLEAGIKAGVKCFINTDTFFNNGQTSYSYLSGYTLTKKQLVEWLKLSENEIKIFNLKLNHIYGPLDSSDKFVNSVILRLLDKNIGELDLTSGEQKRDFVYVGDVVDIFIDALDGCTHGKGFYEILVGSGVKTSIKDFVIECKNTLEYLTGEYIDKKLNFGALPYRDGEIMDVQAVTRYDLPSFIRFPRTKLSDGLIKTIDSVIKTEDKC